MPLIRPPHADPSLDPFDDGVGMLTRDGMNCGHVFTTRSWFWSPSSPFRRQWWIWYTVVWADGSREPETEDYPPFTAVTEMKSGFLDVISRDSGRSGRYDFEWLDAEDLHTARAESVAPPSSIDDAEKPEDAVGSGRAHLSLVEAIAWWRIDARDGRQRLADAATDALLEGAEGLAVAQLAGLPSDENAFEIDRLIEQVVNELELHAALDEGDEILASRFICRELLRGAITSRELTRWAHQRFHHESTSEHLNRLAEIDDDFDLAGTVLRRSVRSLDEEIRLIALRIVEG